MEKAIKNEDLINNYSKLDLEILPRQLRKNGFDYKLIKRENHKCIYSQGHDDSIIGYEVFKTKITLYRDAMIRMKEKIGRGNSPESLKEFKEVFPGNEEFGRRAWSYNKLDNALKKYDSLN